MVPVKKKARPDYFNDGSQIHLALSDHLRKHSQLQRTELLQHILKIYAQNHY